MSKSGFPWNSLARLLTKAHTWSGQQTFSNINVTGGSITGAVTTLPMATAAEITAGTEPAKAIAPDQLKAAGIGLIGSEMFWPTETPPTGWLEEDGSSLVRATYPALFALIGTMYGAADGTHFNLPNMRGKFPRIWAHGQATDPDCATRTAPTATGATISAGDHVGTNQADEFRSHVHTGMPNFGINGIEGNCGWLASAEIATNAAGGNETRPVNTYRMMIIRAY